MSALLCNGLLITFAYLLASFSSAIVVSRLCKLPCPLQEGSKNPGATNVLRLAGKKYAAIVLAIDVLKGFIPVFVGKMLGFSTELLAFAGLSAVLGHMFSLYYRFRGGKGIATAIGVYLALHPLLGTTVLFAWLITYFLSRYSSLSSIVMVITAPLVALILWPKEHIVLPLLVIMVLAVIKHRENLKRLKNKNEPKTYFFSSK